LRCLASSAVNELLVLCNPFSIADKIFWVLRSERKVCTSVAGGCAACVDGMGDCKCNEEIVFDVSDGFSPEEASRKFLTISNSYQCRYTLVAYFLFQHHPLVDSYPLPSL
jgi:hypothetical protein